MISTMTQHVKHFEDFTKAHVESWLKILRYVNFLRTRKCLAALLVSKLIDEDKKSKKQRGKSRAWIRLVQWTNPVHLHAALRFAVYERGWVWVSHLKFFVLYYQNL